MISINSNPRKTVITSRTDKGLLAAPRWIIKFNGGADRAFKLKPGAFDGTFTEMVNSTTLGNYIIFSGVTGSSFTTQTWGTGSSGFNHIGPFGFQIREAVVVDTTPPTLNGSSIVDDKSGGPVVANTLSATDGQGDPLTYIIVNAPTSGTLSGTAPNVTYTPAANYSGSDSFTFKANDGLLDSAPATVSITVTALNDAPVANAQSVSTAEDAAKAITLAGTDAEGGTLTYTIVTQPASGALSGTLPNTWVRLVRSGTTITAYKSTNGTSWTTVGSTTNTTFATTCYIGLAVGSGSDTTLNTSQFGNVSVTP